MQHNGASKLRRNAQLLLECILHSLRNVAFAQTVKAYLADAKRGIGCEPGPKRVRIEFREHPWMRSREADDVRACRDVSARLTYEMARFSAHDMAMGVGHFPPKRSFNAILTDSTAMPGVILE